MASGKETPGRGQGEPTGSETPKEEGKEQPQGRSPPEGDLNTVTSAENVKEKHHTGYSFYIRTRRPPCFSLQGSKGRSRRVNINKMVILDWELVMTL